MEQRIQLKPTVVFWHVHELNFVSQNVCPVGARTLQQGEHPHLDGFLQVKLGRIEQPGGPRTLRDAHKSW